MKKIVVDEAVSEELSHQFLSFLQKQGYRNLEIINIHKEHSGMPDSHIVHHLLDYSTFFLTTDRQLHNTVIARGIRSYHCRHGKFYSKRIKGIKSKILTPLKQQALVLKNNYHFLRPKSDPICSRHLKKTIKNFELNKRIKQLEFSRTNIDNP